MNIANATASANETRGTRSKIVYGRTLFLTNLYRIEKGEVTTTFLATPPQTNLPKKLPAAGRSQTNGTSLTLANLLTFKKLAQPHRALCAPSSLPSTAKARAVWRVAGVPAS